MFKMVIVEICHCKKEIINKYQEPKFKTFRVICISSAVDLISKMLRYIRIILAF